MLVPTSTTGSPAASTRSATWRAYASIVISAGAAGLEPRPGRSTASTRWPAASRSGVTLSHAQLPFQAPWTSTKLAIGATLLDQAAETASASSRGSRRETTCEIPSAPIVTP